MRYSLIIFSLMASLILTSARDDDRQGGGGGRGQGGGGQGRGQGGGGGRGQGGGRDQGQAQVSRPGNNQGGNKQTNRPNRGGGGGADRSPSLNRAGGNWKGRPNNGQGKPGGRPDNKPGQGQGQGNRPGQNQGQRPNRDNNKDSSRKQVQNFINKNKGQNQQRKKDDFKSGKYSRHNHDGKKNYANKNFNRRHPGGKDWFNNKFWDRYSYRPDYYGRRHNWWRRGYWPQLSTWYGLAAPIYYDQVGTAYEIQNYTDDQVQPETYAYNQEPEDTSDDWMPLGVFVAGQTADQAAYSNMYVQLAVNKSGAVEGTYYNSATNEVHPIVGLFDPQTQEVTWKLNDREDSPLMVTGLYNLTQDNAIIRVLFADGTVQGWVLVRLDEESESN